MINQIASLGYTFLGLALAGIAVLGILALLVNILALIGGALDKAPGKGYWGN